MKIFVAVLMSTILVGCTPTVPPPSQENLVEQKRLNGAHKLRKLFPITDKSTIPAHGEAGFFLFAGSGSFEGEKTTTERVVYFAWQDNSDGAYQMSSIPLSHVRIEVGNYPEPEAYFHWYERDCCSEDGVHHDDYGKPIISDTSAAAFKGVDEVTFRCREEDWPVEVQYPMNGGVQ